MGVVETVGDMEGVGAVETVGDMEGVGEEEEEEKVVVELVKRDPLPLPLDGLVVEGDVEETKVVIEGEGDGDDSDGGQSEVCVCVCVCVKQ